RHLAAGLRRSRYELPQLSLKPHRFAFELRETHDRDEILRPQLPDSLKFRDDQRYLVFFGLRLLRQAQDFFLELADPFSELRLLAGPCGLAQIKQLLLAVDDAADVRIVQAGCQFIWELQIDFVPLRLQAGLACY